MSNSAIKTINVHGLNGASYWNTVPGTPTRVTDYQITITDVGNVNLYDQLFSRGVIFRWNDGGTIKSATIITSSYANDTVTMDTIGDILNAGFLSMEYCLNKSRVVTMAFAGSVAAATDVALHFNCPMDFKIFGADIYLGTAGSGTTVIDINKNGTTMFTAKPQITTTGTKGEGFTADDLMSSDTGDYFSVDIDSAGTPGTNLYVNLLVSPLNDIYLN